MGESYLIFCLLFYSMMKKILLVLLFFIFVSLIQTPFSHAIRYQVGVSPPFLDLGDVKQGSSKVGEFYIITSSMDDLLINMETTNGNMDFFNNDKFKDMIYEYSEEDCHNWIEFPKNPVLLKPSEEEIKTDYGVIKGWRKINFILNIPRNAEPGYHIISLKPTPYVPGGTGTGVTIVAVTTITVLFRVSGDAVREGSILDITTGQFTPNGLEIDTYFQNKGTVTVSLRADPIEFYDEKGEIVKTIVSNIDKVKPGDMVDLKAYLNTNNLSKKEYDVVANVNYKTNTTSKRSSITLEAKVIGVKPEEKPQFPWWIAVIIIVIIISYIIYRRS